MDSPEKSKPSKGKGGRPPFVPTDDQRADVSLFAAGGLSEAGIAAELGICRETLRQHFAVELDGAHQREAAKNLKRLKKAAEAGNVTAMKHLDAKFGTNAAASKLMPAREPKLGKKEQQHQAAERAAGRFAVPSAPKLVVNNRA